MKSKKTRKHTVRIAQALALSAFLLAAPVASLAEGEYSNKTGHPHNESFGYANYFVGGGGLYSDTDVVFASPDVVLQIENDTALSQAYDEDNYINNVYGAGFYSDGTIDLTVQSLTANGNQLNALGGEKHNKVYALGAAMAAGGNITIAAAEDSFVLFKRNKAFSYSEEDGKALHAFGGALYSDTGDISLTGGTISIQDNIAVASSDADVNEIYAYGGAVCANDGSILFNGGAITIERNTATAEAPETGSQAFAGGGALFSVGGGIEIESASSVTIRENRIAATDASNWNAPNARGGAVWAYEDVLISGDVVSLNSNSAYSAGEDAVAYGGAIYTQGDGEEEEGLGSITLNGRQVTIESNSVDILGNGSTGHGGALDAEQSSITIAASEKLVISDNVVVITGEEGQGVGGALRSSMFLSLDAQDLIVTGNAVRADLETSDCSEGGALYSASETWIKASNGVSFDNNNIVSGGEADGGAISAWSELSIVADTIALTNNKAIGASAYGGAIYAYEGEFCLQGDTSITVSGNKAVANGEDEDDDRAMGGAIFYYDYDVVDLHSNGFIALTGNCAVANKAMALGGAVMAYDTVSVDAGTTLTIADNFAKTGGKARGGALYSLTDIDLGAGSSIEIKNNYARGSSSALGGALYAEEGVTLTSASELNMTANSADATNDAGAADARGGALYVPNGTLSLSAQNYVFSDNVVLADAAGEATALGGAIYSPSALSITDATSIDLIDNRASAKGSKSTAKGGALYSGGAITLSADTLTARGNFARSLHSEAYGGAEYSDSDVMLEAASIDYSNNGVKADGNGAKAYGGAIYSGGDVSLTGTESIKLTANSADASGSGEKGAEGGAVFAYGSISVVTHGSATVANNISKAGSTGTANAYGGAFNSEQGSFLLSADNDLTIENNRAEAIVHSGGGSVYAYKSVTLKGSLVTIKGNAAVVSGDAGMQTQYSEGGALYSNSVNQSLILKADNAEISGNSTYSSVGLYGYSRGGAIATNGAHISLDVAEKMTLSGNSSDAEAVYVAIATGGALYVHPGYDSQGDITLKASELKVNGNKVKAFSHEDESQAAGGALGTYYWGIGGQIDISADSLSFIGNRAEAKSTVEDTTYPPMADAWATAFGGAAAAKGKISFETGEKIEIAGNSADAISSYSAFAYGGALFSANSSVTLSSKASIDIRDNHVKSLSENDEARSFGGAVYVQGGAAITAEKLTVTENTASSTGIAALSQGGAVWASGDIEIAALKATFNANDATLGGALYSENGDIIVKGNDGPGAFEFATASDDVFAKNGSITVNGALTAAQGTSFTAGGTFSMGDDGSLTLTAQPFTEDAAERSAGDLTIFGGVDANDLKQSINFNRATLTLTNSNDLLEAAGSLQLFSADVATVLYKENPGLIPDGSTSADISNEDWAPSISQRRLKLYIHSAVTSLDEQTTAILDPGALGYRYAAKLVLAFKRNTLIWRGDPNAVWDEDKESNLVWLTASDDNYFVPVLNGDKYSPDSFFRNDIVVFDGNVYDSLVPGEQHPAAGVLEVALTAGTDSIVAPEEVYVTSGEYVFKGTDATLSTTRLFLSGDATSAAFDVPVSVDTFVSVDQATASFSKLTALADTSVDISGKMSVKDAENGVYTVLEGGALTLADGKGTLSGLTVNSGATLNVDVPGQYGVSGTFNALGDSDTNFNFTEWGSESGFGIDGGGTASASVKENARLTISGIAPDAKGTWTLLNNFASIDIDDTAWSYDEGTLVINGRSDLDDYIVENTVRTVSVGKSYILTITRPDGDLIWNGTGGNVWSEGSDERPWLIAKSDDLDAPFEYKGRRFAEAFESGDIVTFNSVGVKQENVTVSGDVHPAWLRVTAGSYSFSGDGVITADTLELDDSKFGTGTNARFDAAVNVNKLLESGAETQAWLNELNMEEKATANVNGQLELANVTGGVFTVNEGGILTLSGGTGSSAMTGLSVNGGATLNVNTLSGYGVTDSFAAEDGSSTVFDFGKEWKPDSGYAIGGNGSAGATLSDGAELTIVGIEAGKEGTWTLLDGFTNVDAGGTAWHFAYDGGTVTIKTPDGEKRDDLDDYVVKTEVVTTAVDGVEGKSYVLTITRPQGELIWNGTGSDVWSSGTSERPWLIASDDLDTAFVYQDRTFASAFTDGKTVTFNSYGEKQTNVTVSGDVTANQLRVTAGEYEFSGDGRITASELMTASKDTKASFAVPVNVSESLDIGAETKAVLEQLRLELNTPTGVSGKLDLATVTGGQFTIYKDGELTLSGGTGSLTGLTLNDGATLNVDSLSSYSVTESFKAHAGSETYFHFGTWNAGDGWGISGLGEKATANLGKGATLTIEGVKQGATGTWNLLSNFSDITTGGWSKDGGTIEIKNYNFDGYTWDTFRDGTNYVLVISKDEPIPPTPPTPPDGELIWTGTDGAEWSSANEKEPWLIASSDDLDKPYTDESGDTVPAAFTNGKTVTFNNEGKDQNIVNVVDAVTADQVRVTAGEYEFSGEGKITASELMTTNEGTTAKFAVPVSLTDKLDIGANTKATLEQLRMELNTPADVSGKLDLATVTGGGKFTVYKDGELTLSGGTGTMTSLTVNDGATLTVNSLGSYSVTDSFSALGGSVTYFNFGTWNAGESWGISGLGESATANLGKGATLTIAGISKGATGKWTLLSNFSSITADGWTANDITIKGYNPSSYGYTMKVYAESMDYVLEIGKDEPTPPVPPAPEPADPGHTEVFHIAGAVQSNVSSAAESAALGLLAVEPEGGKRLWASLWRENGRVSDGGLIQKNRAYGIVVGRDLARDEYRTWGVAAHIGKADTSGKGPWDGATSDTDFWGVMVYGRYDTDKWRFTGDAGVSWFRTDYEENNGSKADNARAAMLSVGGRAYYKWVDDPRPGKMNVYPFVGLRWNSYRQNAYGYYDGSDSKAWTADQILVPIGVKFAWGESVTPSGWRLSPSFELSWTSAFGDRRAKTGIFSGARTNSAIDTPLSDRGTFGAQVRFNARRDNFHVDLNAGVRHSSSETDFNVGATLKWELGGVPGERRITAKKRELGKRDAQLNRGKDIASVTQKGSYSPEFKAKVVLDIIAGKRTLEEVCARYSLKPETVRKWRKEFTENAHLVFMQQ